MPSAPRSNQNRRMSSNSARTAGLAQLKSGCSGANRCRYHSPGVPSGSVIRVQAGPPKIDCQSFGGSSPPAPRPGRNQNRSRSAEPGRGGQRGLEPRVLVGAVVRHDVDDDPDADARAPRRSARRRRPGCRRPARCRGSRRCRSRRRTSGDGYQGLNQIASTPRLGQVGQPGADAGQVADAVAVAVGEAAHVELVDRGAAPPGITRPLAPGPAIRVRAREPAFSASLGMASKPAGAAGGSRMLRIGAAVSGRLGR